MKIETKAYSDGTVATGPAPLPCFSPTQQDAITGALIEARKFALWPAGNENTKRVVSLIDDALAVFGLLHPGETMDFGREMPNLPQPDGEPVFGVSDE